MFNNLKNLLLKFSLYIKLTTVTGMIIFEPSNNKQNIVTLIKDIDFQIHLLNQILINRKVLINIQANQKILN